MIDRATIDRILETARIEDIVSEFVSLKRRGANFIACCPFHHEKTPSFSVSPSKGIYKCFGCGKAGNVASFLMEHEQMSYVEALKYLGSKYGIEVKEKEESSEQIQERLHHESLLIVNDFAQKFFTEQLLETEEGKAIGLSYFKERQITENSIKKFLLGYAPNQRRALTHQAQKRGYKKEHLIEVGLTIERNNGAELIDRFYERVIFPIRGISGKVIAFGGRKLRQDKEIAKYINSPESLIYVKNKALYGLFEAKSAISREQKCYLVEGYTDVISFHQSGIENVVASSGTSLTTGQIQLIKRFTNKVTVLYDGDWAGIKASIRGIDMLLEEGLEIKVALFPDGEDPDSFAKSHTPQELKEFLEQNEQDFIDFKHKVLSQDAANDPIKKAKIITDIISSIAIIPDKITRNVYAKEVSRKLDMNESIVFQEIARIREKRQTDNYFREKRQAELNNREADSTTAITTSSTQTLITPTNNAAVVIERDIIYILINFGNYPINLIDNNGLPIRDSLTVAQYIKEELEEDEIELSYPIYREIFNLYFQLNEPDSKRVIKYFTNHPDKNISTLIIDLTTPKYELTVEEFKKSIVKEDKHLNYTVPKTILIYKSRILTNILNQIQAQIKKAQNENNNSTKSALTKQLSSLAMVRKRILDELKRVYT